MKDLNYGKSYQFVHDTKKEITNIECLLDMTKVFRDSTYISQA